MDMHIMDYYTDSLKHWIYLIYGNFNTWQVN